MKHLLSLITLCCLTLSSFSQNQWAWISGDNSTNNNAVHGTINTPAPSNKPGAKGSHSEWTTSDGNLWYFGGGGYAAPGYNFGYTSDLWKYNPSTNQWTWVKGIDTTWGYGTYGTMGVPSNTNLPGSRFGASCWTDANDNLWLFGGQGSNATTTGPLNDLWRFNPSTNQWTWIKGTSAVHSQSIYGTKGVAASANRPGGRVGCGYAKDDQGNFWMFGGVGYASFPSQGDLNDLWKYNPSTNQWTWISGDDYNMVTGVYGTKGVAAPANKPGSRVNPVCWIQGNYLWVFGGMGMDGAGNAGFLNDLWKFEISTGLWTWVNGSDIRNQFGIYGTQGTPSASNCPGSRRNMAAFKSTDGHMWIFGGGGYYASGSYAELNDLWEYNPSTNQWTWVKGPNTCCAWGTYGTQGVAAATNNPGPRVQSRGLSINNTFWLFGGEGYAAAGAAGFLNDLWKFTAISSTPVCPANTWSGTVSNDWNNAVNWCSGVPASTSDITIPAGTPNSPLISSTANVRNITISSGANLTITGQLNIYGVFSNSGNLDAYAGAGTITFQGTTAQTVPAITVYHLIVNNPAGIFLGGNVMSNTLLLNNGHVTLGAFELTLNNSVGGSGPARHIITNGTGSFNINNVTHPFVFPVGHDAASYNPVTIDNVGGRNFKVSVAAGVTPSILNNTKAINRTWKIVPNTPLIVPATITLQYADAEANSGASGSANMEAGVHNGTAWTVVTPAGGVAPSGTAAARTVTFSTTTDFGPTVIANIGGISMVTAVPNLDPDVNSVQLLSNPGPGNTILRINAARSMKIEWQITDITGRRITTMSTRVSAGQNDIPLSFDKIARGVYYLSGSTSKGRTSVLRWVKM